MVKTEFKLSFSEVAVPEKAAAIIVAAGNATRMKGIEKQLWEIGGASVIERSVAAFSTCEFVGDIIIVTREDLVLPFQRLLSDKYPKITDITVGGASRAESVKRGVSLCSNEVGIVLIHDGARPLVTEEIITRVYNSAKELGAAAPAVPLKDTVKRVDLSGRIVETPNRSSLLAVQTPQGFWLDVYKKALLELTDNEASITDDCSLVEISGHPVYTVEGSYENIKITTPEDITSAEAILKRREISQCE